MIWEMLVLFISFFECAVFSFRVFGSLYDLYLYDCTAFIVDCAIKTQKFCTVQKS